MNLEFYSSSEIAKYIRLSLADENSDESESIVNQRRMINEFINKNGNVGEQCREFIDDGCSGTNFERPGWRELMDSVELGQIKVIITKNLSRLGRSNYECSYYIDCFFPMNGIRYIAIQEQIDTENQDNSNNEYAALNNFINEKYSRDLSKNIRKVYKIKQYAGEYMGGCPIYGYRKDPSNKHHLIIDEEAAINVRKIFLLYLELHSQNKIRKILSDEKILIPEVYKGTRRGLKVKNPYDWNYKTIRDILRNEMYVGNMVQNVFTKKSFRDKKLIKNEKQDWIIVEKTHEAIIDQEIFDQVQELLKVQYRQPGKKEPYLLSGLLFCHECGHRIGIGIRKRKYCYTYCNYYRKNSTFHQCTPHSLNYPILERQLLMVVESIYQPFLSQISYEKYIFERMNFSDENHIKKKIDGLLFSIQEIDLKKERLYMDRLNQIISLETYLDFNKKLEIKKMNYVTDMNELKHKYDSIHNNSVDIHTDSIVHEYLKNINKRNILLKMIDKIEISQDKTIDVYFKIKPMDSFFITNGNHSSVSRVQKK